MHKPGNEARTKKNKKKTKHTPRLHKKYNGSFTSETQGEELESALSRLGHSTEEQQEEDIV